MTTKINKQKVRKRSLETILQYIEMFRFHHLNFETSSCGSSIKDIRNRMVIKNHSKRRGHPLWISQWLFKKKNNFR